MPEYRPASEMYDQWEQERQANDYERIGIRVPRSLKEHYEQQALEQDVPMAVLVRAALFNAAVVDLTPDREAWRRYWLAVTDIMNTTTTEEAIAWGTDLPPSFAGKGRRVSLEDIGEMVAQNRMQRTGQPSAKGVEPLAEGAIDKAVRAAIVDVLVEYGIIPAD